MLVKNTFNKLNCNLFIKHPPFYDWYFQDLNWMQYIMSRNPGRNIHDCMKTIHVLKLINSRAYISLPILYYNGHKLVFSIVAQRQLLLLIIEIPQSATNPYVGCRSQTVVCISGRKLRLEMYQILTLV